MQASGLIKVWPIVQRLDLSNLRASRNDIRDLCAIKSLTSLVIETKCVKWGLANLPKLPTLEVSLAGDNPYDALLLRHLLDLTGLRLTYHDPIHKVRVQPFRDGIPLWVASAFLEICEGHERIALMDCPHFTSWRGGCEKCTRHIRYPIRYWKIGIANISDWNDIACKRGWKMKWSFPKAQLRQNSKLSFTTRSQCACSSSLRVRSSKSSLSMTFFIRDHLSKQILCLQSGLRDEDLSAISEISCLTELRLTGHQLLEGDFLLSASSWAGGLKVSFWRKLVFWAQKDCLLCPGHVVPLVVCYQDRRHHLGPFPCVYSAYYMISSTEQRTWVMQERSFIEKLQCQELSPALNAGAWSIRVYSVEIGTSWDCSLVSSADQAEND